MNKKLIALLVAAPLAFGSTSAAFAADVTKPAKSSSSSTAKAHATKKATSKVAKAHVAKKVANKATKKSKGAKK